MEPAGRSSQSGWCRSKTWVSGAGATVALEEGFTQLWLRQPTQVGLLCDLHKHRCSSGCGLRGDAPGSVVVQYFQVERQLPEQQGVAHAEEHLQGAGAMAKAVLAVSRPLRVVPRPRQASWLANLGSGRAARPGPRPHLHVSLAPARALPQHVAQLLGCLADGEVLREVADVVDRRIRWGIGIEYLRVSCSHCASGGCVG